MNKMRTFRIFTMVAIVSMIVIVTIPSIFFASCERRPELYLRKVMPIRIILTNLSLKLDVYWDYSFIYENDTTDWRNKWLYGWEDTYDYPLSDLFDIRRYYLGSMPNMPHRTVRPHTEKHEFVEEYELGFWDILAWNDIQAKEVSLVFNETVLDSVTAETRSTMYRTHYTYNPNFNYSFNQPEELYSAYQQNIEINENHDGFEWDPERNVWMKEIHMDLTPVTYIYLTQLILHNNRGRVDRVDGFSYLTGMGRSVNVNTGRAGSDDIAVQYHVGIKKNCPRKDKFGNVIEQVDVIGGRVLTFGIPNLRARDFRQPSDTVELRRQLLNKPHHYIEMNVGFSNGANDTTFVFDVTDQVHRYFRGGVITMELNMDTVPIPRRSGGSAFDAVVKEYEEEQYEFGFDEK